MIEIDIENPCSRIYFAQHFPLTRGSRILPRRQQNNSAQDILYHDDRF